MPRPRRSADNNRSMMTTHTTSLIHPRPPHPAIQDTGAFCQKTWLVTGAGNSCNCPWYDTCCCTLASSWGCKTCPAGFDRSCCTCNRWPSTIVKNTVTRRIGLIPSTCVAPNSDYQAGLCYKPCPALTPVGVGPVCYQNSAPLAFPETCSAIMRAKSGLCPQATTSLSLIGTSLVLQIAACMLIPFPLSLAVCDLPFSPGDFAMTVTINAFFARFPPVCPSAVGDPF
jgi:hypothetical protein